MMNRATGKRIADEGAHIRQSIDDILTTPVGSRVKRRSYGSFVPALIDQPANPANRLRLMSATVMAIVAWEPRVGVQRVSIDVDLDGRTVVDLAAVRRNGPRAGESINLAIPI